MRLVRMSYFDSFEKQGLLGDPQPWTLTGNSLIWSDSHLPSSPVAVHLQSQLTKCFLTRLWKEALAPWTWPCCTQMCLWVRGDTPPYSWAMTLQLKPLDVILLLCTPFLLLWWSGTYISIEGLVVAWPKAGGFPQRQAPACFPLPPCARAGSVAAPWPRKAGALHNGRSPIANQHPLPFLHNNSLSDRYTPPSHGLEKQHNLNTYNIFIHLTSRCWLKTTRYFLYQRNTKYQCKTSSCCNSLFVFFSRNSKRGYTKKLYVSVAPKVNGSRGHVSQLEMLL